MDPLTKIRLDIERIKKNHEREINAMMLTMQQKEADIKALEQS